MHRTIVAVAVLAALAGMTLGCGSDVTGVGVISADDAARVVENPPEELVILDVRTPAEFEAERIPGATLIDFYEPDFADQIAELDRDASYVMYCRSGNRSGQARLLMESLGFTDVRDVDGGILSWIENGHALESGA